MTGPLSDAVRDFVNDMDDRPTVPLALVFCTVSSVTANAAADTPGGASLTRPLVTVQFPDGSQQQLPCNADATLSSGQIVVVALTGAYPVLLCRLSSFPPND